jgi:hypothetical protein
VSQSPTAEIRIVDLRNGITPILADGKNLSAFDPREWRVLLLESDRERLPEFNRSRHVHLVL